MVKRITVNRIIPWMGLSRVFISMRWNVCDLELFACFADTTDCGATECSGWNVFHALVPFGMNAHMSYRREFSAVIWQDRGECGVYTFITNIHTRWTNTFVTYPTAEFWTNVNWIILCLLTVSGLCVCRCLGLFLYVSNRWWRAMNKCMRVTQPKQSAFFADMHDKQIPESPHTNHKRNGYVLKMEHSTDSSFLSSTRRGGKFCPCSIHLTFASFMPQPHPRDDLASKGIFAAKRDVKPVDGPRVLTPVYYTRIDGLPMKSSNPTYLNCWNLVVCIYIFSPSSPVTSLR